MGKGIIFEALLSLATQFYFIYYTESMLDNYLNMSSPVLLVGILSIICHAVDSTSHEFFVDSSLVDY